MSCGPVSVSTTDKIEETSECIALIVCVLNSQSMCECGCFVWSVCLLRRRIPSSWECITRLVRFERQRSVYRMRANQSKFPVISCVYRESEEKKLILFSQFAIVVAIYTIFFSSQSIFFSVFNKKQKSSSSFWCLYGMYAYPTKSTRFSWKKTQKKTKRTTTVCRSHWHNNRQLLEKRNNISSTSLHYTLSHQLARFWRRIIECVNCLQMSSNFQDRNLLPFVTRWHVCANISVIIIINYFLVT